MKKYELQLSKWEDGSGFSYTTTLEWFTKEEICYGENNDKFIDLSEFAEEYNLTDGDVLELYEHDTEEETKKLIEEYTVERDYEIEEESETEPIDERKVGNTIKKYIIGYKEIEYRFETKEQAEKFYDLNKRDYMDTPEEIEIEEDINSIMAWQDGIHPYEDIDFEIMEDFKLN